MFKDCFGDSNHLVRRSVFEALGGFNAAPHPGGEDSTGEDWEFFARAALQVRRLGSAPRDDRRVERIVYMRTPFRLQNLILRSRASCVERFLFDYQKR